MKSSLGHWKVHAEHPPYHTVYIKQFSTAKQWSQQEGTRIRLINVWHLLMCYLRTVSDSCFLCVAFELGPTSNLYVSPAFSGFFLICIYIRSFKFSPHHREFKQSKQAVELIETLPASRLPNTISSTFLHIHHGLRALAPKLSHVTFAAQKSKPNRAVTHAARFNRCKCKHANPQALITFSLKPTMVSYSSGYCQAQSALA